MKPWILTVFFFLANASLAGACFNGPDIKNLFSEIEILIWSESAEGNWIPLSEDLDCKSGSVERELITALLELRTWPVLKPVTLSEWSLNNIKKKPYDFFKERVRILKINTDPNSPKCRSDVSGTLAYVIDSSTNEMFVCPFARKFGSFKLQGTLIHEARHLLQHESFGDEKLQHVAKGLSENVAHSHRPCDSGFFAGNFSCDQNLKAAGAYGVEFEFFVRLAADSRVSLDVQKKARAAAVESLLGHFNEVPGSRLGILLQKEDGELIFYDPSAQSMFTVLSEVPEGAILTDRFIPSFFLEESGLALSYFGRGQFAPTHGALAEEFLDTSDVNREGLVDVVFGVSHQCILYSDRIACSVGEGLRDVPMPRNFKPVALSVLRNMGRLDQLVIMGAKGTHLRVPTESPVDQWSSENFSTIDHFPEFMGLALMPGLKRYALTFDGELVFYQPEIGFQPIGMTRMMRFKKMLAPFRWSSMIDEIKIGTLR